MFASNCLRPLADSDDNLEQHSKVCCRETQEHVNSCAVEYSDPEAFSAAMELQQAIDQEWDSLGLIVADRQRPYSALRVHLHEHHFASQPIATS